MKNYNLEELFESEEAEELTSSLYDDEIEVVKAILELKNYWTRDKDKKEYVYTIEELQDAIDEKDSTTYYMTMDDYYDAMDELLEFPKDYDLLERYFDYDAYHRDCEFDCTEASNWVVLPNY